MEEEIIKKLEQMVSKNPNTTILSSSFSLISNFSTSDSTIASLLETLARFLQMHGKSQSNSPSSILKLLSQLSIHHPRLAPSIFDLVRSHALDLGHGRSGAHVLSALVTVADQDVNLTLEMDCIGEGMFLSLCFRATVFSRMWLLVNAERFSVRPSLLITVFLGFTRDSYPYVRRCAVEGLTRLCRNVDVDDISLLGGCYLRGIQLLMDDEDCIRMAAVCAVSEFGMKIASMHAGHNQRDWLDLVFLEVCSSVRDMDVGVRVEVFDSLGRIEMVSENILLQTLSKKVLGIIDIKRHVHNYFSRDLEKQIPSLAGGFLHGLEDEFCEVRISACRSMRSLVVLSDRFAREALNLLVDVLSDYSVDVRLQALSAIHAMAQHKYLKLKEEHMDMFISALLDKENTIRSEARKILQSMETPLFEIFKSCVDGLIQCLEKYCKQEDAHILYTLFKFGQQHYDFSLQITKEFFPENRYVSMVGRPGSEEGRVPAILILAISGTLFREDRTSNLPSVVFLYSLAFLGRFSLALADVITTGTLFSFLSRSIRISQNHDWPEHSDEPFFKIRADFETDLADIERVRGSETLCFIDPVIAKLKDLWKVVQSGHGLEVSSTLRSLRKELTTISNPGSRECRGEIFFVSLYLEVLELLSHMWRVFSSFPPPTSAHPPPYDLSLVSSRLEETLDELTYRFSGLTARQRLCVLELSCVYHSIHEIAKLPPIFSRLKALCLEESLIPSKFLLGLEKLVSETVISDPGRYEELVGWFVPEPVAVSGGRIEMAWAEIEVPKWGPLRPLPFVPGLPVGVGVEVGLHNVKEESRVWVVMNVDSLSSQPVFVERDRGERLAFVAPFYHTPKTDFFGMKIFIVEECGCPEEPLLACRIGGPRSRVIRLCPDKEIFFSI